MKHRPDEGGEADEEREKNQSVGLSFFAGGVGWGVGAHTRVGQTREGLIQFT